jgi:hypothetical protein
MSGKLSHYSGFQLNAQVALSLTPRRVAVNKAAQNPSTVLTVSLCRSSIPWLMVKRAGVIGTNICAGRKTVETVSGSVLSLLHRDQSRC